MYGFKFNSSLISKRVAQIRCKSFPFVASYDRQEIPWVYSTTPSSQGVGGGVPSPSHSVKLFSLFNVKICDLVHNLYDILHA